MLFRYWLIRGKCSFYARLGGFCCLSKSSFQVLVAASRANPNASPSVPGTELRTSRHCGTALHPPCRRGTPSRGTSSSQTTIPRWRLTTTMVRKQRSVLELATFPALPRSHVSAQRQHRSQDRATISTKAISSSTARRDSRLLTALGHPDADWG